MTNEEKFDFFVKTLRLDKKGTPDYNPNRDLEKRITEVISVIGKGFKRVNIWNLSNIYHYDVRHKTNYCLRIFNDELTINMTKRIINSPTGVIDKDDLTSYLYITALWDLDDDKPVDEKRKIGISFELDDRMKRLSRELYKTTSTATKSPYMFKYIKAWMGNVKDVEKAEQRIHKELDDQRKVGEFFYLNNDDIEQVESLVLNYDLISVNENEESEKQDNSKIFDLIDKINKKNGHY